MSVAVGGLGNLILSDEGVGAHVVRRLTETYDFPEDVVLSTAGLRRSTWVEAEHIGSPREKART